jgi:CheY-like chemotaxis protein
VAHDFNNILTIIQGHVGLLGSSPGLNSAMTDSLQQVSQATERARQLTSQLLAFSRKTEMRPARLDLNEVLTHISMMLHRTLGEDINYQFSYAPGLPPIYADQGMLEQVVMILAVNARDAMPRGGQLIISTAQVDVDETHAAHHLDARAGQFVCLSIVDSGCGMDHVTLGRIFEPFFTTKEFGKGTGLGLAVVYGIVKQHQGWIEVQSVVGQGSTFKIFLPPCSAEQAEQEDQSPAASAPGGTETILVVEDEPPVRWIVKNVLERFGYQVLEAGGGVEALAIWHTHQDEIALLLTDLVMPVGLSGQELAEKFQIQKPSLKVIYTSGYSVQVAGRDLALVDGLDFLQKPFDPEKLARSVRKALDRV